MDSRAKRNYLIARTTSILTGVFLFFLAAFYASLFSAGAWIKVQTIWLQIVNGVPFFVIDITQWLVLFSILGLLTGVLISLMLVTLRREWAAKHLIRRSGLEGALRFCKYCLRLVPHENYCRLCGGKLLDN